MIRKLVIAIAALAAIGCSGSGGKTEPPVETIETMTSDFRPGQEWAYRTRPGEESSTLTVLRVERAPKLGVVVHVSVDGIRLGDPARPPRHIGHLPMSEDALRRSVTRKLRDDAPLPGFEDGYAIWREAYDGGEGGAFSIPVAEVVATIAATVPR